MAAIQKNVRLFDPSQMFRPDHVENETGWTFRSYVDDAEDKRKQIVKKTYTEMHTNMTMDYVKEKMAFWCKFNHGKRTIMDALDQLNYFIDESDPDTELPNIYHAFQTAERIRKEHPDLDWFHLTGLIHDLGKIMSGYGEPQWSTTGDTFPVGCQYADSIVYRETSFNGNPDLQNEKYSTKNGIYTPNCGLENVTMSWGHDEYMYRVLKHNNSTLPNEALFMIRYHSFYPWHTGRDYLHLCNEEDLKMMEWVNEFNKFDLYTKQEAVPDVEKLKPYYQALIDKYCPGELEW